MRVTVPGVRIPQLPPPFGRHDITVWRFHLTVRIQDSQSWHTGSIPVGATKRGPFCGPLFVRLHDLFLVCSRKRAPFHYAWRPSGTAFSLQAFARTNTYILAYYIVLLRREVIGFRRYLSRNRENSIESISATATFDVRDSWIPALSLIKTRYRMTS